MTIFPDILSAFRSVHISFRSMQQGVTGGHDSRRHRFFTAFSVRFQWRQGPRCRFHDPPGNGAFCILSPFWPAGSAGWRAFSLVLPVLQGLFLMDIKIMGFFWWFRPNLGDTVLTTPFDVSKYIVMRFFSGYSGKTLSKMFLLVKRASAPVLPNVLSPTGRAFQKE